MTDHDWGSDSVCKRCNIHSSDATATCYGPRTPEVRHLADKVEQHEELLGRLAGDCADFRAFIIEQRAPKTKRKPRRLWARSTGVLSAELLFEPRDLWAGLFWDDRDDAFHLYLALIPCLPLHITLGD